MIIDSHKLTTCAVIKDGQAISLGLVNETGNPVTIRLSLDQVSALIMTLPRLIDMAVQTHFGDQSLRYTHRLTSWAIEQSSDPTQNLISLGTEGGFGVCFSSPHQQLLELGQALVEHFAPKMTH